MLQASPCTVHRASISGTTGGLGDIEANSALSSSPGKSFRSGKSSTKVSSLHTRCSRLSRRQYRHILHVFRRAKKLLFVRYILQLLQYFFRVRSDSLAGRLSDCRFLAARLRAFERQVEHVRELSWKLQGFSSLLQVEQCIYLRAWANSFEVACVQVCWAY